jgi:ABC-type transport system involved in multi-copper enzyme maturation permease subunit
MIWWKEWRETRFGFLTALFLVSATYFSLPENRQNVEGFWLGVFALFFATVVAISLGSSAVSAEVGADTMPFLLSKPTGKTRLFVAKYLIRAVEAALVFLIPIFSLMWGEELTGWMWVRPYLMQKYIAAGALSVLLVFSGSFFLSIVFKNQARSALAGVAFLAAYLALMGIEIILATYELARVDGHVYLLAFLCLCAFVSSLVLFKKREF